MVEKLCWNLEFRRLFGGVLLLVTTDADHYGGRPQERKDGALAGQAADLLQLQPHLHLPPWS